MMSKTLKEMIGFLDIDQFKKITNTHDFSQLSEETKEILKNYGLPSSNYGTYPNLVSSGKLKLFKPNLIEIGVLSNESLGVKFCIDLENHERVILINSTTEKISTVNSSLRRFIECKYTMAYYYKFIEFAEKHGEYYENENYKKYAQILRDMLEKIEPGIENYEAWQEELFHKEHGVI